MVGQFSKPIDRRSSRRSPTCVFPVIGLVMNKLSFKMYVYLYYVHFKRQEKSTVFQLTLLMELFFLLKVCALSDFQDLIESGYRRNQMFSLTLMLTRFLMGL